MTPAAAQRRRVRAPVVVVTTVAWVLLVLQSVATQASGTRDPAHPAPHHAAAGTGPVVAGTAPLTDAVVTCVLMLLAMMSPLVLELVRVHVALSLPRRRAVTLAAVLLGYGATWALPLAAVTALMAARPRDAPAGVLLAVALVAAAVWQCTPAKQRALNATHRHPGIHGAGRGWPVHALALGARHGVACVAACWALMAVPLLAGGAHLAAMVVVTAWMWAERVEQPAPPCWRVRVPTRVVRIVHARLRPVRRSPDRAGAPVSAV